MEDPVLVHVRAAHRAEDWHPESRGRIPSVGRTVRSADSTALTHPGFWGSFIGKVGPVPLAEDVEGGLPRRRAYDVR
eukprot:11003710-Heterocapsa_arctica.AAC.1